MYATYSPEDDKIRLFFEGERLPRTEWDALRDLGYTWTMKQSSDMVAVWSPAREDAALEYCGEILDEDQPRLERSADRAERFTGYLEKRTDEATEKADNYEAGPSIHGHQSETRAERQAKKHDRQAAQAVNLWSKAEYWQRRTEGVLRHALYLERADVRHRRIKTLEAEMRKYQAEVTPSEILRGAEAVERYCGKKYVEKGHDVVGIFGQGRAKHARSYREATGPANHYGRSIAHLEQRIAYEKQMLLGQGGTLADVVEMIPGGFLSGQQIQKITKDRAGLVSTVYCAGCRPQDAEDFDPESYRAPTDAELAEFTAKQKAIKDAKPKAPPLINPTLDDAKALQEFFNTRQGESLRVSIAHKGESSLSYWTQELDAIATTQPRETVQSWYSERSSGVYATCNTLDLAADWTEATYRNQKPVAFRIRTAPHANHYGAKRVVVLTDKPQKAIPARVEHASAAG